jgi:hypothetical protein
MLWLNENAEEVVNRALSNVQLWDTDLSILSGFSQAVKEHIFTIERIGIAEGMRKINSKKIHFNEKE